MLNIKNGVTLIEVIVAVAILGLIGVAMASFSTDVFYLNNYVQNGLSSQMDAREVVKQIASELREASPGSNGAYPIEVASTSEITFYDDIDNDGVKEKIHYYVSGLFLKKDVVKATGNPYTYTGGTTTTNVINDVRNGTTSVFLYYDKNYDGTSAPLSFPVDLPSIRLVKVTLSIDHDPYRSPIAVYASTVVTIRNLKDNL